MTDALERLLRRLRIKLGIIQPGISNWEPPFRPKFPARTPQQEQELEIIRSRGEI